MSINDRIEKRSWNCFSIKMSMSSSNWTLGLVYGKWDKYIMGSGLVSDHLKHTQWMYNIDSACISLDVWKVIRTILADKKQIFLPQALRGAGIEMVWSASVGPTPLCWRKSHNVAENPTSHSRLEHQIQGMRHCDHHKTDNNQTHHNPRVLLSHWLLTGGVWVCMQPGEHCRWLLVTPFRMAKFSVFKWTATTKSLSRCSFCTKCFSSTADLS